MVQICMSPVMMDKRQFYRAGGWLGVLSLSNVLGRCINTHILCCHSSCSHLCVTTSEHTIVVLPSRTPLNFYVSHFRYWLSTWQRDVHKQVYSWTIHQTSIRGNEADRFQCTMWSSASLQCHLIYLSIFTKHWPLWKPQPHGSYTNNISKGNVTSVYKFNPCTQFIMVLILWLLPHWTMLQVLM